MGEARLRFKKVYVEITSACNLACSFCPPTRRPQAFATLAQFQRIVNQVIPFTRHIHLHVKGEPLLHPQLPDFLDIANEAGLRIHLVTNGTLIDRVADRIIGHPALHPVNFSLHSFSGPEGAMAAYLDPILGFARRASSQGNSVVALRFWRTPAPGTLEAVEREWNWTAPAERTGHGFLLAPRTFVHFDNEFAWPSLEAPIRGPSGFCLGLRDQAAILVDGTVVPCCLDGDGSIDLGNMFTEDFAAILAAPRAQALYQGFTERRCVEPLCQRCGFRARFDPKAP